MAVRGTDPDDLPEILAMVQALADYEREPDAVVLDPDEFPRNVFGVDTVAHTLVAEHPRVTSPASRSGSARSRRGSGKTGIWLEDLFVRPQHRRGGVDRRAPRQRVRARTNGRVEWAVLDWNTLGHDFYRSLGAAPQEEWTTWRWLPTEPS